MASETIHFNSSMKLPGTFKSQGQGECGRSGYITGWPGVVTCKACQKVVKAEQTQAFRSIKNVIK